MKNDLCSCIAIVLDGRGGGNSLADSVSTRPVLTSSSQQVCLVSGRRRDKSVLVSEASVLPLQRRDVEAPEGSVTRLIPRLKKRKGNGGWDPGCGGSLPMSDVLP